MNASQMKALQAMFGQQQRTSDGLVSFKAGRMDFDDTSKMVTAQKKPGKIRLKRDDFGTLKFQWVSRLNDEVEVDLSLFPNSAKWEKINECTDGRVYLLRMTGSSVKRFFWLQESNEEKDVEYFEKVNKLCKGERLENEPAAAAAGGGAGGAAGAGGANAGAAAGMGGMSEQEMIQQALMASMQQPAGAGTGAGAGSTAAATQQDALQQMIFNAFQQMGGAAAAPPQMSEEEKQQIRDRLEQQPNLTDILNPQENAEIEVLLTDDDHKVMDELKEFLPEDMNSPEEALEQMQSPEFRSSLARLQSVLNSPNMEVIVQQMGLEQPSQFGVEEFINAIVQRHQPNADDDGADIYGGASGDVEMSDAADKSTEQDKDKDNGDNAS